jgi:uncharacterized tellurite resistance protein B-like protein
MIQNYQLGLLFLVKLLIDADGFTDETELRALYSIRENEGIPDTVFELFQSRVSGMPKTDIYHSATHELERCTMLEKLNIFALLYKLSEVDGRVHVKEIKLILDAIKTAGLEFDEVVNHAKSTPALMV